MVKVLFVCMGNICRSPAGEGIFAEYAERLGWRGQLAWDSAGTLGSHAGEPPDRRMVRAAAARGYNLVSRARQFRREDFDEFDRIVVMDDDNYATVLRWASSESQAAKVVRMADYHPEPDVTEIPDPYMGGPEGFEYVLDALEVACRHLMDSLIKEYGLKRSS